jgi:hypothetical protein
VDNGVFTKYLVGGFYGEFVVAVSSNSCTSRFGLGVKGGSYVGGAHRMHYMSCLSRDEHSHLDIWHVHGSSHKGVVLSGVHSLMLLVLIRVKQHVVGWASSVFASACTALACQFVFRLFMCLLMQHVKR